MGTATSVIMPNTNYIQQSLNQISITPRISDQVDSQALALSSSPTDPTDGYSSPSSLTSNTSSHENVATIQEVNEEDTIDIVKKEPGNSHTNRFIILLILS